jgi:hypothetical protein
MIRLAKKSVGNQGWLGKRHGEDLREALGNVNVDFEASVRRGSISRHADVAGAWRGQRPVNNFAVTGLARMWRSRDVIRANRGRAAAPLICPVPKATLPPAWCSALPRSQRVPVVVMVGRAWRRLGGPSALVCPPRAEKSPSACAVQTSHFNSSTRHILNSPTHPHHNPHTTIHTSPWLSSASTRN